MSKNTEKVKETKNNLCEAFIELFSEKEIRNITIKNITDKAGYNRGTFYLYYTDVYDMLNQVKSDLLSEAKGIFVPIISAISTAPFSDIVKAIIGFYEKNQRTLIPLIIKDASFSTDLKRNFRSVFPIDAAVASDPKNDIEQIKLDYIIEYHFSAVISFLNYWYQRKRDLSIEDLLSLLLNISKTGPISMLEENKFFDKYNL